MSSFLYHFVAIFTVCSSWSTDNNFVLPEPITEIIDVYHNDTLYILGGEIAGSAEISDHIYIYNPRIHPPRFIRINESQPAALHCGRRCAIPINDMVYVFPNGNLIFGIIWLFNMTTNKFDYDTVLSPMPHHVYASCIAADTQNGLIYLIGGVDEWVGDSWQRQIYTKQVQVFNVTSKEWLDSSTYMEAPVALRESACEYFNGKIFVFGGIHRVYGDYHSPDNERYDFIYKYDIGKNTWTKLADTMSTKRSTHRSLLSKVNNLIYIIGGYDGTEYVANVDVFDPATERIQMQYTPIIFVRTVFGVAELLNKLYVFGGQYNPGDGTQRMDNIEISNQISLHPTMTPTSSPTNSTYSPSGSPTHIPTKLPTKNPTENPSISPSLYPTKYPTEIPTKNPSENPTEAPTKNPTQNPTKYPTETPTKYPTKNPSISPSLFPSLYPTKFPTENPTKFLTKHPSKSPPPFPSSAPTIAPSYNPTVSPTLAPTPLCPTVFVTVLDAVSFNPNHFNGLYTFLHHQMRFGRPVWQSSNGKRLYYAGSAWIVDSIDHGMLTFTSNEYYPPRSDNSSIWRHSNEHNTFHVLIKCISTYAPISAPTFSPTYSPTVAPIINPSNAPSTTPTSVPTINPTTAPTEYPSVQYHTLPTDNKLNVDSSEIDDSENNTNLIVGVVCSILGIILCGIFAFFMWNYKAMIERGYHRIDARYRCCECCGCHRYPI
eukprot:205026_1